MTKILLISTNRLQDPYPVYPVGISYLKTYLENQNSNFQIDIFDFNLNSNDDLISQINSNSYNYICLSLRNIDDTNIFEKKSFIENYQVLMLLIKEHSTSKIIIGGSGFSIYPTILFDALQPDFAIYSEGEMALNQLINALENNQTYENIESLIYKNETNEVVVNPKNQYLHAIDLKVDDKLADYYWKSSGMLSVQTKRGCPFNCIYCSYPIIEGKKLRTLDVDCVVENIKNTTKKGMNYFFFTDSVFNIDRKYNQQLAEKIILENLKINWGAYFTPFNLEKEELALYKKAGLTHVEFGTDSFSDSQLFNYQKNFTFSDIEKASKYCSDLGIFYAHFLILGGIGETEATLNEGFENSQRIENTLFFPFVGMRIYPKTPLCDIAKKEGIFENESELLKPVYYIAKNISPEMIKAKAKKATGKWIFGDEESSEMMNVLRERGRKGPLWEYLRY